MKRGFLTLLKKSNADLKAIFTCMIWPENGDMSKFTFITRVCDYDNVDKLVGDLQKKYHDKNLLLISPTQIYAMATALNKTLVQNNMSEHQIIVMPDEGDI